jgi:hypothetical protein
MPSPFSSRRKEFSSNQEPIVFGKGLVRALASLCFQRVAHRVIRASWGRHGIGGLHTKPFSALGPPTAHDLSSTSCFHTSPKSVGSLSSNRAGLIGAFHDLFCLMPVVGNSPRRICITRLETPLSKACVRTPLEREPIREAGSIPQSSRSHVTVYRG